MVAPSWPLAKWFQSVRVQTNLRQDFESSLGDDLPSDTVVFQLLYGALQIPQFKTGQVKSNKLSV
jgi:hypothetical protein